MPLSTLTDRLFSPVRAILERLLPQFAQETLDDPLVRAQLIRLADSALISQFPAARALPSSLRKQLIAQVLDSLLAPHEAAALDAGAVAMALEPTPEDSAVLDAAAPGNSVLGFLVDGETSAPDVMQRAADEVLGPGWSATPVEIGSVHFTLTNPAAILSVAEAWDLSHRLEEHPAVALAEPSIEWVPAPPELGGPMPDVPAAIAAFGPGGSELDCSGPKNWSVTILRVSGAWNATPDERKQGVGVKIGHLDTGLTNHQELQLNDPRILLQQGANIYDPNHPKVGHKPLDPMDSSWDDFLRTWFIPMDGHGTGTLSVLLSQGGQLTGTAPRVTVVPFRVNPTVVHWSVERMADGFRRAHIAGCDVITLSMGGPPSRTGMLEEAVRRAAEDGVIICAAAANVIGSNNVTPIVVWPAALDQVIAVAGTNCRNQVWSGSSRGPEVNISAPAQDIWHAIGKRGALPGANVVGSEIKRGNGTSFATPAVAGIAACWLARHGGRSALAQHYGHARYVPLAFTRLLRTTAFDTPPNWRADLLGPGILNAEKLLTAPLPSKASLTSWPEKKHALSSKVLAGIFRSWYWLTGGGGAGVAPGAAPSEADAEAFVERFGGELLYHLYDRPALLNRIAAAGLLDIEGAAGVSAAVQGDGTLTAAAEALRALKSISSKTLAEHLP